MKILIVITRGDAIGGAQIHVLTLAKLLKKNGHEVLICYGGEADGPFKKLLVGAGLRFINLSTLKREISLMDDFLSVFKLRQIYNRFEPDLISLHSSKAGIIGRLSGIFSGVPIVFTVHGWAFTDGINRMNSTLYKILEKTLAILATKIIVVSYYDKDMALKNGVANSEKIEVVHNGIEVSNHKNNALAFKNVVDVVMIARFDLQKDHETLIRACVGINKIKVHFLGDGPNLEKMIKLADELAIRDKFEFYGYSNKVEDVLQRADVFVLISNWEGFPISTLEAINQNLPVIISDVGGAREAIIEGETGYSVKRKDITDLNTKLVKLINNASLRRSMGDAGKKLLVREFSSEVMYKNTLNVFQKAIRKKRIK